MSELLKNIKDYNDICDNGITTNGNDKFIGVVGHSGDGKTYTLLKLSLTKMKNTIMISFEETTTQVLQKINKIKSTIIQDEHCDPDDIEFPEIVPLCFDNPEFNKPLNEIILELKEEIDKHFDVLIIDSYSVMYRKFGTPAANKMWLAIKEVLAPIDVTTYVIAHFKSGVDKENNNKAWEDTFAGGSELYKQLDGAIMLTNDRTSFKVIKKFRNSDTREVGTIIKIDDLLTIE